VKSDILHLAAISRKRTRIILGLMSGTSLDGLDLALCACTGSGLRTRVQVLKFTTMPYDEAFKTSIRQVFAQRQVDLQHLTLLNVVIAERHAAIINQCLQDWQIDPATVDLIASHGQTVFHAPRIFHGILDAPNATLQLGDGDHLARRTGIITLCDFRQKHLAAGGEGAPLALYGDYLLFSKKGQDRFLLNIGGIANFTFLPADGNGAFATDTGPGNTLIDAFARSLFEVDYDRDALLASAGRIDEYLLTLLKSDPFFDKPFPKTTGPEQFSMAWAQSAFDQQPKGRPNPYDQMATLTRLTAETIADAIRKVPISSARPKVFTSGGGAHNLLLLKHLKQLLPNYAFQQIAKLGIDGDAKEAVLFAVLANETVAGAHPAWMQPGDLPAISMGKICLPG
jgi:anhydro-N-acetylmuramic acid kinase